MLGAITSGEREKAAIINNSGLVTKFQDISAMMPQVFFFKKNNIIQEESNLILIGKKNKGETLKTHSQMIYFWLFLNWIE